MHKKGKMAFTYKIILATAMALFFLHSRRTTKGMSYLSAESEGFLIKSPRCYTDLPFEILDELTYPVYVIDYNWIYLFINKDARSTFGRLADQLIGKSAVEIFSDARFYAVFDKIKYAVQTKNPLHAVFESPLRGRKIVLKGHPLEDCYYFSAAILPAKHEIIDELREELKRRQEDF